VRPRRDPGWLDPVWQNRRKHIPPPGLSPAEVGRATEYGGASYYHPNFRSDADRRRLEMMCVTGIDGDQRVANVELHERSAVRCFFVKVEEAVIGYSDGEATHYVYAEWSMDGSVHGRPVTAAELSKKGADRELLG
jgi:hypothetical protein